MKTLKRLTNFLNSIFGVDAYFEIDQVDAHIAKFGLDEMDESTLN